MLSVMMACVMTQGLTSFADDDPTNEYFSDDFSGFAANSTLAVSAEHPAYTAFANASAVNLGEGRESVVKLPASAGSDGELQITCPSLEKELQLDFMFDRAWTEYSGLYFILHNGADNTQQTRLGILPTVSWAQLQTVIPGQSMQWTNGFNASVNTWYTVKMRLRNNTVYIKLWKADESEPASWGYSLTGSGLAASDADTLTVTAHEDGATTNTYIDNIVIRTWDTSKAPVYEDGNPKYTYLEDSFEDFAKDTALSVDENNPVYNGFNRASVVKYSDERPSVMKLTSASDNNGSMSILCPTLDKEWSFDLLYDANWDGYNGLYTVLHKEADDSACRFGFLPTAGNPDQRLQISVPGESLGWSAFTGLSANTWYTFKLRLRENVLSVKVYAAGSTEPAEWSYSKTISAALAKNDEDILSIMGAQGGGTVNTYIDNMKIMTWEEVKMPTVKTDEPEFIYYEDDFATYDEGTLEKHETKAVVSALAGASIGADGTLILSSDNQGHNSHITVALPKAEKRIDFDFKLSRASSAWGRMSVSFHSDENGGVYSYAVFPGATWGQGKHLQMVAPGAEQWLDGVATGAATWYSCTIQLRKNVMSFKVWEKNGTEPDAWTYSYTIPNTVTENATDSITITNYEQDGGYNDLYLDNLVIKTWEKVEVDTAKVDAPASDSSMGATTGGAEYLAGTSVTLEATAKRGYRFNGWKVGEEIVSTDEVYTFTATEDITVTAMFSKAVLEIKAITAVGQTLESVIDTESKTATIRLASDTDLSAVNMFFYTDPDIEIEESNYLLDLSSGSATVGDWTVVAEKNDVMTTFYVDSTTGNDGNDGLSEENAFETIEKAINAASEIEEWTGDVVISLAEGVYTPKETLTFTPSNGAERGYALIIDGGNSAKTVVSGGVRITEWTASDVFDGVYEADMPTLPEGVDYVRDLYVDGVRATLARSTPIAPTNWDAVDDPNFEKKEDGYVLSGDMADMLNWKNKSDIELVFEQGWKNHVIPVLDVTNNDGTVYLSVDMGLLKRVASGLVVNDPNFVQNAIELLDEPGECYFDRATGKIYYFPMADSDINDSVIVVPLLEKLIEVCGTEDESVYGIHIKNISFRHTSYLDIHNGHADLQSNFQMLKGHSNILPSKKTHNALTYDYAQGARIESCSFSSMATGAIDYGIGVRSSSIYASSFRELGATAIQIGGHDSLDAQPMSKYMLNSEGGIVEGHEPEPYRITRGILVLSNDITRVAQQLKGGVGIWAGYVSDTTISHNEITDLPYTGISAGWGWGAYDKAPDPGQQLHEWDTPSALARIVIENNDVHDIMQYMYDGACIYTNGYVPGSIISGNLLYNSRHFGIYNDQGSGGYSEIAENIMYKCNYGAYYYHNMQNLYTARMKATEKSMYGNYFEWESSADEYYNYVRNRAGTLDTALMGEFAPEGLVAEQSKTPVPSVSDSFIKISENSPVVKTNEVDGFDFDGRAIISLIGADGEAVLEASENKNGEIPCGFTNLPEGEYSLRIVKKGIITYETSPVRLSDGEALVLKDFAPIYGDIIGSYDAESGDGTVNIDDFVRVLRGFSDNASEQLQTVVDLNGDGSVNVSDLAIVKKNFGKSADDYE